MGLDSSMEAKRGYCYFLFEKPVTLKATMFQRMVVTVCLV